jgi:hypothetical protein
MGQAPRNKPKRLGEKLLQIREALGLSQKEMAKRLAERTGFKITLFQPCLRRPISFFQLAANVNFPRSKPHSAFLVVPDIYNESEEI